MISTTATTIMEEDWAELDDLQGVTMKTIINNHMDNNNNNNNLEETFFWSDSFLQSEPPMSNMNNFPSLSV